MAPSFDADGERFRRAATERLSPYRALAGAAVEPLPHQIDAVYHRLLARRPVRFLLADDPGTGKTIVAGLLLERLVPLEEAPDGDLHETPAAIDFAALRPPDERERAALARLVEPWIGVASQVDLPSRAAAPLAAFRDQLARRRAPLLDRIEAEVTARLEHLADRLAARRERLSAERRLDDDPPRLVAACLLVPAGALATSAAPPAPSAAPPCKRP